MQLKESANIETIDIAMGFILDVRRGKLLIVGVLLILFCVQAQSLGRPRYLRWSEMSVQISELQAFLVLLCCFIEKNP